MKSCAALVLCIFVGSAELAHAALGTPKVAREDLAVELDEDHPQYRSSHIHQEMLDKTFDEHIPPEQLQSMFKEADADGSGFVSRDEFIVALDNAEDKVAEEEASKEPHEMDHQRRQLGGVESKARDDLWKKFDRNNDGRGTSVEFKLYMLEFVEIL